MTDEPTLIERLRECPFCGGIDEGLVTISETNMRTVYWVRCNMCATEGPGADTQGEAHHAWNTRAADALERAPVGDEGFLIARMALAIEKRIKETSGDQYLLIANAALDVVKSAQVKALSPNEKGGGWLPIESAPHAVTVLAARFDDSWGEWIYGCVMSPPIFPFTHWQPLPEPPQIKALSPNQEGPKHGD